jgi:hypothetical protein
MYPAILAGSPDRADPLSPQYNRMREFEFA